jgi:16S rRNA (guanine527-N7)-methyltransferase
MSDGREPLPPENFRDLLGRELPRSGLNEDPDALDRLSRFLSELDRWRGRINLTGRLSPTELVSHTAESLLGGRLLARDARVVDIGTGGGFPGVALAIGRRDLDVTWLEPREKRATFLKHVARSIPVENARIVVGRVELLAPGSVENATSRAVKIETILSTGARFLAPGGALILWTTRAQAIAESLAAAGLRLEESLAIPDSRQGAIARFRKD